MRFRRMCLATVVVAVSANTARAADDAVDVRVRVGDIYDRRASDPDKAAMVIELRTKGNIPEDATHFRWHLTSAVDTTGRNLLLADPKQQKFEQFSTLGVPRPTSAIKFRSPARSATAIAEFSGELHLFLPQRDPRSTVVVDHMIRRQGESLSSESLRAAGVKVALLTKNQYDARKKEQEARQAASQDTPGPGEVVAGVLYATFATAFGGIFGGGPVITERCVLFQIEDRDQRLVDISFADQEGEDVSVRKWRSQGDLHVCALWDEPSDDTTLTIYLRTQQSVLTIPFHLTDIALP